MGSSRWSPPHLRQLNLVREQVGLVGWPIPRHRPLSLHKVYLTLAGSRRSVCTSLELPEIDLTAVPGPIPACKRCFEVKKGEYAWAEMGEFWVVVRWAEQGKLEVGGQ